MCWLKERGLADKGRISSSQTTRDHSIDLEEMIHAGKRGRAEGPAEAGRAGLAVQKSNRSFSNRKSKPSLRHADLLCLAEVLWLQKRMLSWLTGP